MARGVPSREPAHLPAAGGHLAAEERFGSPRDAEAVRMVRGEIEQLDETGRRGP